MDCEEDSRETDSVVKPGSLLGFVCLFVFCCCVPLQVWNYVLLLGTAIGSLFSSCLFFFLLKYFYVSVWFTVQFYLFMVYCFSVLACWAKHLQILLVLYSPFTHDSSLLYKESRVFHTWFIPKLIPNMSHDLWPSYPGIGQNIKLFTKTEDAIKSLVKSNFSLCVFIFMCITYGICVQFCNTVLGY